MNTATIRDRRILHLDRLGDIVDSTHVDALVSRRKLKRKEVEIDLFLSFFWAYLFHSHSVRLPCRLDDFRSRTVTGRLVD